MVGAGGVICTTWVGVGGAGVGGRGVLVEVVIFVAVGVQVGGNTLRGVGVAVGKASKAGSVGGGKGLSALFGFEKTKNTAEPAHRAVRMNNPARRLITVLFERRRKRDLPSE
jgi:hypothetical protein